MTIKIDQALVKSFDDGGFGLTTAYENDGFTPTKGTAFAALRVFMNEIKGFTLSDLDSVTGVFQIALNYPAGNGAIAAKTMENTIFAAYPVGKTLTYSGQSLEITGKHRWQARPENGWFRLLLRLNFVAYVPR